MLIPTPPQREKKKPHTKKKKIKHPHLKSTVAKTVDIQVARADIALQRAVMTAITVVSH